MNVAATFEGVAQSAFLLMLCEGSAFQEQAEMRNCLEGMEIIATVSFDSKNLDDRVRDELR